MLSGVMTRRHVNVEISKGKKVSTKGILWVSEDILIVILYRTKARSIIARAVPMLWPLTLEFDTATWSFL